MMIEISHYPNRAEAYSAITPQIRELLRAETDLIANMANIAAMLYSSCGFFWVGFYRVIGDQLVLGPFQGPAACTRIKYGRGVCGTAWQQEQTIIVPDVEQFDGHIACSNASKSEVVVPLMGHDGKVLGVLDVDSDQLNDFSQADAEALENICKILLGC